MKRAGAVVAGVVVLALAVVLLAPASLVDAWLAARTAGRVRLADAGGVWWRGHGVVAAQDAADRLPVSWRVSLPPLLGATLVVELVPAHTGMPSGTVAIGGGEIVARMLQVTLPAGLLRAFVPALAAVAPDGAVDVRAPSFAWRDSIASGRIDASWRNARLAIAGIPVALGRVVGAASGAPDGVTGSFEGTGGDVALRGTWRIDGDAVQAATTLAPTDATPPALRAMLPLLGPADANGAVHLEWRGRR